MVMNSLLNIANGHAINHHAECSGKAQLVRVLNILHLYYEIHSLWDHKLVLRDEWGVQAVKKCLDIQHFWHVPSPVLSWVEHDESAQIYTKVKMGSSENNQYEDYFFSETWSNSELFQLHLANMSKWCLGYCQKIDEVSVDNLKWKVQLAIQSLVRTEKS
jgi:hypothetical protein